MEEGRIDLDNYMLELVGLMSEDWQGVRSDKFSRKGITERRIPGKGGDLR